MLNNVKQKFFSNFPITKFKIFVAKGLYLLVKTFWGQNPKTIKRNEIFYFADPNEGIDLSLILFGRYQPHVIENKIIKLSQSPVIFDVGANIGAMSLGYSKYFDNSLVYSFEPTEYAFEKLQKNISLNDSLKSRIYPYKVFLSNKNEGSKNLKLYSSWKMNTDEQTHTVHGGSLNEAKETPVITLDSFVKDNNISKLDLIKIDTDGSEMDVLEGARGSIENFHPKIVIEVSRSELEFSTLKRFTDNFAYELFDLKTNTKVTNDNFESIIPMFGTTDIIAI